MKIDGVVEWVDDMVVVVEIERSNIADDVIDALAVRIRDEVRVGDTAPEVHFEESTLLVAFDRKPHPAIEIAAFLGWLAIICQDFEDEEGMDDEFIMHLTGMYADHRVQM